MAKPFNNMKIGIVGKGFVGNAVYEKFKSYYSVLTYDLKKELSNSTIENIAKKCKIIFICVPTPMNMDGSCNVLTVESVLKKLNKISNGIIVNKSTVPPGTTEMFRRKFLNLKIIYNPEFLTEKNAVKDFFNQKRIMLGGSKINVDYLTKVYSHAFPKAKIIVTDSKHAEMVKYFTNCFLSTKVSFANEMYNLCESLNLNYNEVVKNVTLDKRIGKSHLSVPGPDGDFGFGGHCLPKDITAIIKMTDDLGTVNNVIKSVLKTNDKVRLNRDWEKMKGRAVN